MDPKRLEQIKSMASSDPKALAELFASKPDAVNRLVADIRGTVAGEAAPKRQLSDDQVNRIWAQVRVDVANERAARGGANKEGSGAPDGMTRPEFLSALDQAEAEERAELLKEHLAEGGTEEEFNRMCEEFDAERETPEYQDQHEVYVRVSRIIEELTR